MLTSEMREQLHRLIENGDERLIKLMHAMATAYSAPEMAEQPPAASQMDKVADTRLSAISNAYTWNDPKTMITGIND